MPFALDIGGRRPAGLDRSGPTRRFRPVLRSLAIRVQPADAEVLVDGERWEGFEGPHVVEVRRDGYRTYRAEIDLPGGETTLLNVSLPSRETGDPR